MTFNTQRFNHLEGLRGLAAIAVVIHHLLPFLTTICPTSPLPTGTLVWPITARGQIDFFLPVHNGEVAVWVFWTLSGFVLSIGYFQRITNTPDEQRALLLSSTLRRYPRLFLPILASCLVSFLVMKADLTTNLISSEIIRPTDPTAADWLSSLSVVHPTLVGVLSNSLFFASTYNAAAWTMPKELLGSLFVFCYLALIGHSQLRRLGYAFLIPVFFRYDLAWLNCFVTGIALADFYTLPLYFLRTRILGSYSIQFLQLRESIPFALIAFVTNYILASIVKTSPFQLVLISIFVVASVLFSRPLSKLLSLPWIVFLGRISFGIYLLHMTIICSFSGWLLALLMPRSAGTSGALVIFAGTLTLCTFCGWLFFRCIDAPSVSLSKHFSRFLMRTDSHM
jgi:peptidoglycan/LPS O-acetylase OafA/YrhL